MSAKKYRERINHNTFWVYSTHSGRMVHDIIKGWGTVSPSGKTVLWETWRKPTAVKQLPARELVKMFDKIVVPAIKAMPPQLVSTDIISVQPMTSYPHSKLFDQRGEKQPEEDTGR